MERDIELIRNILFALEKQPSTAPARGFAVGNHADEKLQYHLKLLHQAGFIDAINTPDYQGDHYMPKGLTWQGHEFLDAVRDDTRWENVKTWVLQRLGHWSFDIALAFAKRQMKEQFGADLIE
jgi:hypothetical protein